MLDGKTTETFFFKYSSSSLLGLYLAKILKDSKH
jgi:hypothetical protein